jgi:anaerobic selenocysteine-containing dehydrogenase
MLLRTACPLDCPDTCSLEVEVDADAEGRRRLVRVDAAPPGEDTNPFTQGWICKKVKRHAERVHGDDRVLTPLVRIGPKGSGEFRAAGWDEALDLVAARCVEARDRYGAESVVPYLYNSSAGALGSDGLTPLLWRRFGASRVAHTICAATAGTARRLMVGTTPSADPAVVRDAALVVIWGANPTVSNTHWPPYVQEARARGAQVVVVDPRRTAMAARAELHLAVRPGTDVVLALALATELARRGGIDETYVAEHVDGLDEYLEAASAWSAEGAAAECGLAVTDVERFAELLTEVRPAFFRLGWGIERNRNGGSAWRAALALPALTGSFDRPGAGAYWSTSRSFPWDGEQLESAVLDGADVPPPGRLLNQNLLGRDLGDPELDPPVAVLFVQGANPAVMNPDQLAVLAGLARDDLFCVVHDQVLTDTARFADVVLPATTHFEAADVASSYGSFGVEPLPPVIDRVGESRTNDELAAGLAERFGYPAESFDPDPARLLALVGHGGRDGWAPIDPGPQRPERIRLVADAESDGGLPVDRVPVYHRLESAFPLTLLSPANPDTVNSMFGERADVRPRLTMHPDDAAARGIADGAVVRVHDDRAAVEVPVRVDASTRPGVVVLPKGLWRRSTGAGLTANAFAPATLSDLAGGACFNDARVEVSPVA